MKYLVDPETHWDIEGYWKSLGLLEHRLSKRSFAFFSKHTFHDALVLSFSIINKRALSKRQQIDPTVIEARLIDYTDDYEYLVRWVGVAKFQFNYNKDDKVYIDDNGKKHYEKDYCGLESWNIDEIGIVDDEYLSHEIELHSGAKITIQFRSIDFKRLKKQDS